MQTDALEAQIPTLNSLIMHYEYMKTTVKENTTDWTNYNNSLTDAKEALDNINKQKLELNIDQASRNITNLENDMTRLSQRYSSLESSLSRKGSSSSMEDTYNQMIDVAMTQRLNKLSESSSKE